MQFLFTFTVNTETKEATYAGNTTIQAAAQILQQLAVADAAKTGVVGGNGEVKEQLVKEG